MVACLRNVPQSDLLALAATLRLLPDQLERIDTAGSDGPAGGRVAQPSAAWLADQAARIPALPPSLLRPAVCQPRLPPPCLCAAHRQLHPDLVRELFAYLTREVTIRADPLRRHPRHDIAGIGVKADSNNNKKCQSLDVREWGDRMLGLSALWCNSSLFSQLWPGGGGGGDDDDGTTATTGAAAFAWRLRDRPPHLALPCEACVLAVVGGRREALVDLRAGILCRVLNELEKRRRRQQQRAEKRAARVDEDGGGGGDEDEDEDEDDDDDDNETVAGLLSSDVPHLLPVLEKYMVAFGPDDATVLRDLSMRLMMSLVPVRQCETRRRRLLAGQRRRRHHDVDTDNDDDDDNKQHGSDSPASERDGPHHADGDPPRLYTPSGHPLPLPLLPPDHDPYAGVAWDRPGCQAPFFATGTKAPFRASPAPAPAPRHDRRPERPVISTPTLVSSSVYGTLDTCDVDDTCVDEPYTVEEVDDCNGGDDGGDGGCVYVDDVGVDAYAPCPTTDDAVSLPNEYPPSPLLYQPATRTMPPLECEPPWGFANGRASTRLPMSPMSPMSPTSVYSYDNRDDGCWSRAAPAPPAPPAAAISAAAAERRRPYENMSLMRPSSPVLPDRKPAAPPLQHIPHTAREYLSLQAEVARAFSMDSVAVGAAAAAAAAAAEAHHKESARSSVKARASAAVIPEQEPQRRPRSQPSPQRRAKAPSPPPTREIRETRTPASSPRTRPRQTPQPRPVPPAPARCETTKRDPRTAKSGGYRQQPWQQQGPSPKHASPSSGAPNHRQYRQPPTPTSRSSDKKLPDLPNAARAPSRKTGAGIPTPSPIWPPRPPRSPPAKSTRSPRPPRPPRPPLPPRLSPAKPARPPRPPRSPPASARPLRPPRSPPSSTRPPRRQRSPVPAPTRSPRPVPPQQPDRPFWSRLSKPRGEVARVATAAPPPARSPPPRPQPPPPTSTSRTRVPSHRDDAPRHRTRATPTTSSPSSERTQTRQQAAARPPRRSSDRPASTVTSATRWSAFYRRRPS